MPMKILAAIWLSAIGTFGLVSAYLLSNEKNINAPGELGEALSALGIVLAASLLVLTAIVKVKIALSSASVPRSGTDRRGRTR